MDLNSFTTIRVHLEDGVAVVTLSRPDRLNAFTVEMVRELRDAIEEIAHLADARCIVLTGAGRAFCAGADVDCLKDVAERRDQAMGRRLVDGARGLYRVLGEAPQPVLAALNGVAAGGGANLALACDLRLAAETARIGQVFGRIGLHPDWGGTYFLPRLVGPAKAMELFLSGDLIEAPQLLAMGLVNRVVPAADLVPEALAWARRIAAAPPVAVRHLKQCLRRTYHASLEEMLDHELEAQLACFQTADFQEGLSAYFAKREPHFTGR
jgi:2-(1,2-epoxy-1,2-dihydrophenyl)acetyl-CoA isomerase